MVTFFENTLVLWGMQYFCLADLRVEVWRPGRVIVEVVSHPWQVVGEGVEEEVIERLVGWSGVWRPGRVIVEVMSHPWQVVGEGVEEEVIERLVGWSGVWRPGRVIVEVMSHPWQVVGEGVEEEVIERLVGWSGVWRPGRVIEWRLRGGVRVELVGMEVYCLYLHLEERSWWEKAAEILG